MKRYFLPVALLALLAGCTSETFNTESLDNEFVSHVTITASDFEMDAATRTSLELTSSGLSFTWAESDVVGIYPNAGDQVSFPMTKGAGTKTAIFDGGGWALKGNYTYAAYYPYSVDNTTYGRSYTALPISYKGQTQPANNSTAGLGTYDYMVATASTPESGNVTFNFQHIGSVLYLQLTTPDAATFTKLTLSSESPIFTTEATVNISDATLSTVAIARAITLDLDDIAVETGGTLYAWLLIAPTNANGKTLTATLTTSESESYTVELAGKNYLTGKAYQLKGTLTESGTGGTGEDIGWGDELVLNGHEFVDLGLPSGTLWATMNVGATSPEGYGNYYAWGEIETKDDYNNETYKFFSNVVLDEFNFIEIIMKYNTNEKYGKLDGKTVLDPEDDTAHVNWGGSWRMPTHADWDGLTNTNNCTWEWATLNGVNGYKVTSKVNGNSIFLPAAGRRTITGLEGSFGYYWSSSLYEDYPHCAWDLYFISDDAYTGYYGRRDIGHTVRPICHP
jgi:hypothetical protein